MELIEPTPQMWLTMALTVAAVWLFAMERIAIEVTSLLLLASLLLLFEFTPITGADGADLLDPAILLRGFANPALITVIALMVMGQGVIRTGALNWVQQSTLRLSGQRPAVAIALAFGLVLCISPFFNNTPIVVMFIPVLLGLARAAGTSASVLMMPLSFVSLLAGTMTLIGTSTNLLVSGVMTELEHPALGFFEMTAIGAVFVAVGVPYLVFVAPRLLGSKASLAQRLMAGPNRRFLAQVTVSDAAPLVGKPATHKLLGIKGARLILVQRGEHAFPAPFEGCVIEPGDDLVLLATREAIGEALTTYPGLVHATYPGRPAGKNAGVNELWQGGDQYLIEAMVPPGSRLIGQSLEETRFRTLSHALVLGIRRRSRMIRQRMTEIRLAPGDILVLQGLRAELPLLRERHDITLMDGSVLDLPTPRLAARAGLIFLSVVLVGATQLLPISVAAVAGAAAMIASGVLPPREAADAVDRKVILLVGASLALASAVMETGAAIYLAQRIVGNLWAAGPVFVLSGLFLVVMLLTNILSNNATAVLFTPIAIGIATGLGEDPRIFALAVLFASNCSFATPMGYQTNLLVMGPGQYTFADFVKVGTPLCLLLWLAFSIFAPWYYGM